MTTGTATVAAPLSPFAVFRNRSFALMWSAEFVSSMGSALTSLAASILVFRLTGSALSVGLMLMATAAPSVFIGLLAGVFVDRYDRKRIMISADLVRAALVASIPLLVPLNIAWLYVIVALSSAVGQFFSPAHESVLPDIASDRELAAANSLMAISAFGSTAIGFAASTLLPARAGEIVRPVALSRMAELPFTPCLLSIALERLIDLLSTVVLFVIYAVGWAPAILTGDEASRFALLRKSAFLLGGGGVAAIGLLTVFALRPDFARRLSAPLLRLFPERISHRLDGVLTHLLDGIAARVERLRKAGGAGASLERAVRRPAARRVLR